MTRGEDKYMKVAQDVASMSLEEDRKTCCVVVSSTREMLSRSCNVQGRYAYALAMANANGGKHQRKGINK